MNCPIDKIPNCNSINCEDYKFCSDPQIQKIDKGIKNGTIKWTPEGVNDYVQVPKIEIKLPFAYAYKTKEGKILIIDIWESPPQNSKFMQSVYSEEKLALFLAREIACKRK